MKVKITESIRYADPVGPHLPQIDFVEASVVVVSDEIGASLISNGHGVAVDEDAPETGKILPESKEAGLVVQSKEGAEAAAAEAAAGNSSEAYDNLPPKKQLFVNEYLVDSDATQAAIRAGYSENTAEIRGSALLEDSDVAAAIAERSD